jgi:FkbM family methyltransferase
VIGDMVVPVNDPPSAGLIMWGNLPHETRESQLIRCLARECHILFDIGAHIGWYARLMAANTDRTGQVFAFEPNPHTNPYLYKNTRDYPSVAIYPLIVSDVVQRVTLYCAESSNLSSIVRKVGEPVTLPAVTLDHFCAQHENHDRVDFVKCDVEGGELAVLRGSRRLRGGPHAPIWMIEVEDGFMAEANITHDQINTEIFSVDGTVTLFELTRNGQAQAIQCIGDHHVPNVFVVPGQRLDQFTRGLNNEL